MKTLGQFLLFFLVCVYAKADQLLAKAEIPLFYTAVEEQFSPELAHNFFEPWTQGEAIAFHQFTQPLLKATILNQGARPSLDSLIKRWQEPIFGHLGELHGSAILKQRAAQKSSDNKLHYLNGNMYRWNNSQGKAPDGILFETDENRIVIHQVFESKMGSTGYDSSQSQGLLKHWQKNGLKTRFPIRRQYKSQEIFFADPHQGLIPLSALKLHDFKTYLFLIATREHPNFPGEVYLLPFSASSLRECIQRYIQKLLADDCSQRLLL